MKFSLAALPLIAALVAGQSLNAAQSSELASIESAYPALASAVSVYQTGGAAALAALETDPALLSILAANPTLIGQVTSLLAQATATSAASAATSAATSAAAAASSASTTSGASAFAVKVGGVAFALVGVAAGALAVL